MEKKRKPSFISKYINEELSKNGRKKDSNFYRQHLKNKKIPFIHFLVKNVEQLLIMDSISHPAIKLGLIDRFLVFAHYFNVKPIILITKTDLEKRYGDRIPVDSQTIAHQYKSLSYDVFAFSNKKSVPIDTLVGHLKDKKTAIIGHSGVGKTTLLQILDATYRAKTNEVSYSTGRGKHTTTKIYLHPLSFGGSIYDMPGLKEMNFITISKRELSEYFIEFEAFKKECYFRDCYHIAEKVCGVKKALDEGKIYPSRYNSYISILENLPVN